MPHFRDVEFRQQSYQSSLLGSTIHRTKFEAAENFPVKAMRKARYSVRISVSFVQHACGWAGIRAATDV